MPSKDEKLEEQTLYGGLTEVPPSGEDYSLEEILAEYGMDREQRILRDVEAEAAVEVAAASTAEPAPPQPAPPQTPEEQRPVPPQPAPDPEEIERARQTAVERARQEARDKLLAQAVDLEKLERECPNPRPISLEEVVGTTVSAVMEETMEPLIRRQKRRGLFSRRPMEDTEELYDPAREAPPPEPEPEEYIGPEPELNEAAADFRREARGQGGAIFLAAVVALFPAVLMAAEQYGLTVPLWSGDATVQSGVILAVLGIVSILARRVWGRAFRLLARRRFSPELLAVIAALAAAGDCVVRLTAPERTAVMPYGAVSAMGLVFAMWGAARESRGFYDTFRTAGLDDAPPYLVTETERGACKQRGATPGFYTVAGKPNLTAVWSAALLPVVLAASLVFAGLSSLGLGRGADFLLNWSAILTAGTTFALPICWALPWSRLARHLQKAGCAVAGWAGADKVSRQRRMIVSDTDLFPPGTIQLNGVKVYGEELRKAASYAATVARAAGCGLERVFEGLMRGEGGRYAEAVDFSFYEEGGYSATIRGESVLMGTTSFMRKMAIRLPGDVRLKTGIFLAVDRELVAVFAVKYHPAENVDFALRMMRRSRVTPILAARDPNITPDLLRRKFHKKVRVEYPDLTERVALSEAEQDHGMPRALLLREGLMPYAEVVVGSRRLCRTVRRLSGLSFFSSAAGTLLAFYLVFQGAYDLLTPLALLVFLLLWTLPVLLMADWAGRY